MRNLIISIPLCVFALAVHADPLSDALAKLRAEQSQPAPAAPETQPPKAAPDYSPEEIAAGDCAYKAARDLAMRNPACPLPPRTGFYEEAGGFLSVTGDPDQACAAMFRSYESIANSENLVGPRRDAR